MRFWTFSVVLTFLVTCAVSIGVFWHLTSFWVLSLVNALRQRHVSLKDMCKEVNVEYPMCFTSIDCKGEAYCEILS